MKTNKQNPVEEGDELEVKIESIGSKGDGVAKYKGLIIFIPQTKINESYKIRITKLTMKNAFAIKLGE